MKTIELEFTGKKLRGFDGAVPATCIVRNDLNGWRKPNQVLRELDGHVKTDGTGTPYQPRQFPAGRWEITEVVWMPVDSLYWPVFIRTNAHQRLQYWALDEKGNYDHPTGKSFRGTGYALHYARVKSESGPVPSQTTLGCLNIPAPNDVEWIGEQLAEAMGQRVRVYVNVPPWDTWEV